jgi:YidC/Oxa1 family membrane protein insertase
MQQKIMKYMMVFMALIFYKVASGLCLYFIVSTLWGIGERKLLPKPPKRDAAPQASKPNVSGSSSSSNGRGGKKSTKRAKQPRK